MDQIQTIFQQDLRKYLVGMCSAVIVEIHSAVNMFKMVAQFNMFYLKI